MTSLTKKELIELAFSMDKKYLKKELNESLKELNNCGCIGCVMKYSMASNIYVIHLLKEKGISKQDLLNGNLKEMRIRKEDHPKFNPDDICKN